MTPETDPILQRLRDAADSYQPVLPHPEPASHRTHRSRVSLVMTATVVVAVVAVVVGVFALANRAGPHTGTVVSTTPSTRTSAAAPAALCLPSDIEPAVSTGMEQSGIWGVQVQLTNISGDDCTVAGYPAVSFSLADGGVDHFRIQRRETGMFPPMTQEQTTNLRPTRLTIRPGGAAQFYLITQTHAAATALHCPQPQPIWNIRLAPGQALLRSSSWSLPACEFTDIAVSPYTTISAARTDPGELAPGQVIGRHRNVNVGRCLTTDVTMDVAIRYPGGGNGASEYIRITAKHGFTCTVDGYPAVLLDATHQNGLRVEHGGAPVMHSPRPRLQTVTPRSPVYFGIGWYPGHRVGCAAVTAARVSLGSGLGTTVPLRASMCPLIAPYATGYSAHHPVAYVSVMLHSGQFAANLRP